MKELIQLFKKYNIEISEDQAAKFDIYFSTLVETNKRLNLTAITEKNEVYTKHFLDSVLPHELIPENSTLLDVGSGAGFPAIPLKIVRDDLKVVMLDSLNKRVNFLKNTTELLGLQNIEAVHSRAEDYAKEKREFFDIVVARAVASLETLVEYLLPFVKVGGFAIIYKSAKLEEELSLAKKAIDVLGGNIEKIKKYTIDDSQRNILVLKKVKQTPVKYPRGQNKPRLNPIK